MSFGTNHADLYTNPYYTMRQGGVCPHSLRIVLQICTELVSAKWMFTWQAQRALVRRTRAKDGLPGFEYTLTLGYHNWIIPDMCLNAFNDNNCTIRCLNCEEH